MTAASTPLVRVEAIVRPFVLDDLKERLQELGIGGMTVVEVRGFGRTAGRKEVHRGSAYVIDFIPKIMVQVVVPAARLDELIDAIRSVAATGRIGDGKIFILPVLDVVRIRTGERGESAV